MPTAGSADVPVRNERKSKTKIAGPARPSENLQLSNSIHASARGRNAPLLVWAIVAGVALLIVAAIIAAPLLQASGHAAVSSSIYKTFSFVCHQIPERSFHLACYKFAVCSRCTGIYAGFALAALSYPLVRKLKHTETPSLIWLFLAVTPLAIDWSLGYFSIWQNNHASRFATGFLLGAVTVFYILPGLIELSSRVISRRSKRQA
jgi:uncharacterized membrane protein